MVCKILNNVTWLYESSLGVFITDTIHPLTHNLRRWRYRQDLHKDIMVYQLEVEMCEYLRI